MESQKQVLEYELGKVGVTPCDLFRLEHDRGFSVFLAWVSYLRSPVSVGSLSRTALPAKNVTWNEVHKRRGSLGVLCVS